MAGQDETLVGGGGHGKSGKTKRGGQQQPSWPWLQAPNALAGLRTDDIAGVPLRLHMGGRYWAQGLFGQKKKDLALSS
jgi:hypothetical protein